MKFNAKDDHKTVMLFTRVDEATGRRIKEVVDAQSSTKAEVVRVLLTAGLIQYEESAAQAALDSGGT